MLTRQVINYIIEARGYTSYLEVGTHKNATFDEIVCNVKVGIDPVFPATYRMR